MSWSVKSQRDEPIDVTLSSGRQVTLQRGETFETESACEMIDFLQSRDPDVTIEEGSNGWMNGLIAAGREAGCVGPDGQVNATPAGGTAVAPPPAPPAADGDSAAAQGAPQAAPGVQGNGGPDGGSAADGGSGPPRPGDSRPREDEPRDHPPGEADSDHGGAEAQQRTLGGDPVDLFSGAFLIDETDLTVETAMLPLRFRRFYRSGRAYYGPFGWGWDHNHNQYLRELDNGALALWTGQLHEKLFRPNGAGFDPPAGTFEQLERAAGPATRYVLTRPGGLASHYFLPAGWTHPERIPLVEIRDRHGNRQRYDYDADGRLAQVIDDDGRFFRFAYGACGLLERLEDHAGRTLTFRHDLDVEHLIAVVDETGSARRQYRYAEQSLPDDVRHNIVEVLDGSDQRLVSNEYDLDPASWSWGRIAAQMHGDYLYQFRYTQLQWTPALPPFANTPSVQVEVMDPAFAVSTSTYNSRGDLLDYRFRLCRDGSFRVVAYQFEYDGQCNRTLIRYPDGREELFTYLEGDPDPRNRGLLDKRELRARPGFPSPSRIVWRGTYEAAYQLPRSVTDEAGNEVRYHYDHDGPAPGATGKLVRIEFPQTTGADGASQSSSLHFETNARGQVEAIETARGTRTLFEFGAAGADRGLPVAAVHDAAGAALTERFVHDDVGNVIRSEDPLGAAREYDYDGRRAVIAARSPDVGGAIAQVSFERDGDGNVLAIERPRGAYADAVIGTWPIRDVLCYNALGHVVEATLAANTQLPRHVAVQPDFRGLSELASDDTGMRVRQTFDERGMLLSKRATGRDGSELLERSAYDLAGRRTHHWTGPMADVLVTYEYDAFGRIRHIRSANGSTMTYVFGDDDLLEEQTLEGDPGDGSSRLLRKTRYEYDERGRLIRQWQSAFTDDPAAASELATLFFYDEDSNRIAVTGPRGETTSYSYDALGRQTASQDPGGNRVERRFDGLDRLASVTLRDLAPGGTAVRTWSYASDARGRRTATVDPLGNRTETGYDERDLPVAVTGPDGVVERRSFGPCGELLAVERDAGGLSLQHRWAYDAAARLQAYTDPSGEVTAFTRDGVGRETGLSRSGFSSARTVGPDGRIATERLPSGATLLFTYDGSGRLATIGSAGAAGVEPAGPITFAYDGADRAVLAERDGRRIRREFDSLGRLVAEDNDGTVCRRTFDDLAGTIDRFWPDGRRERISTNDNGFPVRIDRLASGALGDGGPQVARLTPHGAQRIARAELLQSVVSTTAFDLNARPVELKHQLTGADEHYSYRFDGAGRRRFEQAQSEGFSRLWQFDAASRVTGATEGFAPPLAGTPPADQAAQDADIAAGAAASAGGTREAFSYNAGDERTQSKQGAAPAAAYSYLPGHRVDQAGTDPIAWHADGVRASSGGRTFTIDALGQVTRIDPAAPGAPSVRLAQDGFGRPSLIDIGGVATRLFYFGDELLFETQNGSPSRAYSTSPLGRAPVAIHVPGTTLVPLTDLTGSGRLYCDSGGSVLERHAFAAFGAPSVFAASGAGLAASAIGIAPVFAGMRWLPEAGLYLTRSRLYDPVTGMFLSPDPLGVSDSPNPYAYARLNPADYVDPDGEFAFLAILGIMAVGALIAGGLNIARQGIAIAEGAQDGFSWSELGMNMGLGALFAPIAVFAPEVAIPFVAMGMASGVSEISRGHYATGLFDIGTSIWGARSIRNSGSFLAPREVRITNFKVEIARTDLNQSELALQMRRLTAGDPETRAGFERQIGDLRIARSILDDPTIQVRSFDPASGQTSSAPLGFDPAQLGWDGIRRDVTFYRPNGDAAGDLDLSFPRFDVEIKLGERASDATGKVQARNTYEPSRAGMPYYLASEIPANVLQRWQAYPRAVPIDLKTAARFGYDGHLQVTPEMRGGLPYFFSDLVSPGRVPFIMPSVGRGNK